jgi:DNA end-binding protein Ku
MRPTIFGKRRREALAREFDYTRLSERPAKGGQKVYSLLRQALDGTGKVAIATFVMRGRQHLSAVIPQDDFLMLNTLRFANDVLPPSIKTTGKASVTATELAMAKQLVEGMSGPFKPEQFKDTYRADLLRKVKEKIKKRQIHSLESEPEVAPKRPKAQVIENKDHHAKSIHHWN